MTDISPMTPEHRCFICNGGVINETAWIEMTTPFMPRRWFCPVHHVTAIRIGGNGEISQIEFAKNR